MGITRRLPAEIFFILSRILARWISAQDACNEPIYSRVPRSTFWPDPSVSFSVGCSRGPCSTVYPAQPMTHVIAAATHAPVHCFKKQFASFSPSFSSARSRGQAEAEFSGAIAATPPRRRRSPLLRREVATSVSEPLTEYFARGTDLAMVVLSPVGQATNHLSQAGEGTNHLVDLAVGSLIHEPVANPG